MSTLHAYAHARFHEVFGEPQTTLGKDDHWELKPSPDAVSINVLVDGSSHKPSIWVFDPYDRSDGVSSIAITSEQQVEETIKQIQERLRCAAEKMAHG